MSMTPKERELLKDTWRLIDKAMTANQSEDAPRIKRFLTRAKERIRQIEAEATQPEAPSAQPVQPTDLERARELWNHLNDKSRVSGIEDLINFAARERRETAQRVCNNVRKHFYPRADHRYPGVQIAEWLDEAGKAEG